jgi:hypothetical protein
MLKKFVMTLAAATLLSGFALGVAQAASKNAGLTGNAIKQDGISSNLIAREAGEAARGRDNERAGDRQRGRTKLQDQDDQIARESTEAPRGQDNNRHRRNRGQG